jgi:hypothetical protein
MTSDIKTVYALIFENDKRVNIDTHFTREEQLYLCDRVRAYVKEPRRPTQDNPSGRHSEWAVVWDVDSDTNSYPVSFCNNIGGGCITFPESWLSKRIDQDVEINTCEEIYGNILKGRTFTVRIVLSP